MRADFYFRLGCFLPAGYACTAPPSRSRSAAVRDGTPLPEPPKSTLVRSRFVMRWEEQTRPPLQKCWLLSEVFACERTKLQVLNEGGEEFDGEDA